MSIITDKTAITRRVMLAFASQNVPLADVSSSLEYVEFTLDSDGDYGWIARVKDSPHYSQPMRSSGQVTAFKTLEGAKRNFLRHVR